MSVPRKKYAIGDNRLTVLAIEINEKLTVARRHGQATLSAPMDVGDRLEEAKKSLKHGQWDDWLTDNFALSDRTARLYMQLAGHRARVEAKMATVADLGIHGALPQISEDQMQEGREKRNRELLARELAQRGSRIGPEPKPNWVVDSGPIRSRSNFDGGHGGLEGALNTVLMHIQLKREWIAQFGLLEEFDAELRRRLDLKLHKPSGQDAT